jgi:prepilin-type processing-associated H-X9-DG protein
MYQEWMALANACWPRPYYEYGNFCYGAWHVNSGAFGTGDLSEEYSNIHSHGGNFAFADGHCEWRPHIALHASDFGLTGGAGVSGNATDGWQSGLLTYLRAF